MPDLEFVTLDVFTRTRYAGNPLALVKVPSTQHVPDDVMQTIAREFNLSETIFLHEPRHGQDGTKEWRVRIFLTSQEVPFAGHPTIGAAVYALGTLESSASQGRLLAGAGPIELQFAHGIAKASIPHNFHLHTQYPFRLEDLFGLQPSLRGKLDSDRDIEVLSPVRGMTFVTVKLPDLDALATITTSKEPAPRLDDEWNVGFAASYFWVMTNAANARPGETITLRTRMIEGAFEDPATGSAACALACRLSLQLKLSPTNRFEITQAVEMGRRSDIGIVVVLDDSMDAVSSVELSGSAVKVMSGTLEY